MAAVQCDNFVGNAWKKDLCLNCFKSKEEHLVKNGYSDVVPTRIPDPPKEGILKGTKPSSQTPKRNKVIFLNTECEVIGFGGDDVYSDEEDFPNVNTLRSEEEDEIDSEEDKAFQKLTKTNTDFNSISENLKEPKNGEVKKVIEPLKLGKQMFDEKGNKKTLLVSVTPFGDQTLVKNKINMNGFKIDSSATGKEIKTNGHDSTTEPVKNELLVRGKIKTTEEKSETSVNGRNAEEICANGKDMVVEAVEMDRQNKENTATQLSNEDNSIKQTNDKSLKRSQPLNKNFKFRLSKDLQKETEKTINGKEEEDVCENDKKNTVQKVNNFIENAKNKVNQFPIISDNQNHKFGTKDLSNGKVKKLTENNKNVTLGVYKIRENGDVKIQNEINEKNSVKNELATEKSNGITSPEVKINSSNGDVLMEKEEKINGKPSESETAKDKLEIVQNGSALNRSKLIPNVSSLYRHHFKNTNKSLDENPYDYSGKTLMNGVTSSMPVIPTPELRYSKSKCTDVEESRVEGSAEEPEETEKCKESELSGDEKFKKSSFDSFENFEKIIEGEEITLFSAEETREISVEEEENCKEEKNDIVPEISRESAGEPDGRADSDDLSEPPALPLKPPPPLNEPRTTFLHDFTAGGDGIKIVSEKPKVPAKPIIIQSKKINFQSPIHSNRPKSPSVENFLNLTMSPQVKPHTHLQESLSSDSCKNQKRPAPKPPSPKEDSSERYVAVFAEVESDDSGSKTSDLEEPVVKRISDSTENILEFITDPEEKNQLTTEGLEEIAVSEPFPRRGLSLSQDNLVPGEIGDNQSKKKPNRGRFFLRKLLHLGKTKETTKDFIMRPKSSLPPFPKTKLEIIHPSDLNGSRVEVVPPARTSKSRRTSSSASSSSGEHKESDVFSDSSTSHSMSSSGNDSQNTMEKTKKPPPPPRSHSFDTWSAKPARPPPPKSIDILRQSNSSWSTSTDTKSDNLYVNLGEARSGLAPNKPLRTGSLREANIENSKRLVTVLSQPEDSDYESFVVAPVQYSTPSHSEDNLYECVQVTPHRSSLPECDSGLKDSSAINRTKEKKNTNSRNNSHRRSEGNVDLNSDYFKMKFMRSMSLTYCASETESEIYSPYSFYCSEMGDEDYDLSTSSHALRISRLKLKKGRSIVHKNLEDNYGAVVIANHEALAQVAEQMRQGPTVPPALRSLSTAVNLRWSDFTIVKDVVGVVVGRRVFYPALWGTHAVTLSLMAEQGLNSSFHAKGPFNLNPLTELNDLVPASYLSILKKNESELVQASISVLSRLQIESVETYGKSMSVSFLSEESKKEVNFVLLQIIIAFKTLQAQGIEEAPKNLTNLIVCREEKDPHPRVCIIHSFERNEEETPISSLCQCATHAIKDILPPTDLTPLISHVLQKEKADSLSQAKGILEFSLWGPADIAFGNSNRERETSLQRWLDLERATVLHGLVRTRAELTVFEEWQLLFLVRTNAKMMAEASLLLECGVSEEIPTA